MTPAPPPRGYPPGRTYRSGNAKRKEKAAKESESVLAEQHRNLSLRRIVPRSRNQIVSHSVP